MKNKLSIDSFLKKSVSNGHLGRPCSDFFKICSSYSKVHKVIFPAAYSCLNGIKTLLNTKNSIEKGSIFVSCLGICQIWRTQNNFCVNTMFRKVKKKMILVFFNTQDHISVKDFNLENFVMMGFLEKYGALVTLCRVAMIIL